MKLRAASGLLRSAGLALVLAPLLAACGDDPAPVLEEGEREASEEVLEGTISDNMLPLDQVRSQAPQAELEPEDGAASEENAAEGSDENAAEPAAEADSNDEAATTEDSAESE